LGIGVGAQNFCRTDGGTKGRRENKRTENWRGPEPEATSVQSRGKGKIGEEKRKEVPVRKRKTKATRHPLLKGRKPR